MREPVQVTLLMFEGCDLLDVGGPYEVLLTANRVAEARGDPAPFAVRTVTPDGGPVHAYGGLRLTPDGAVDPGPGLLLVPGAIEVPTGDRELLAAIVAAAAAADVVTSVCTGALLLAAAGLLDEVPATTHHEDIALLAERIGAERALRDVRWVDAGDVVTAGGLASGIAMALHLVARATSVELARAVAHKLEYPWTPDEGVTLLAR